MLKWQRSGNDLEKREDCMEKMNQGIVFLSELWYNMIYKDRYIMEE